MTGENDEQRRLKRWRLIYYLRVFDLETDEVLGHVADISMNGLMLVHDEHIELDKNYSLGMEIPSEESQRERLSLQATSVWSSSNPNPAFRNTGFKLLEPDEEAVELIMSTIDDLGFD